MKIRHRALLLATTLFAAPALVSAAETAPEGQPGWHKGQMKEDCGPRGMKEAAMASTRDGTRWSG
ncbi:hypothetical protein ACU6RQ_01255 [Zobellella denitrificans]